MKCKTKDCWYAENEMLPGAANRVYALNMQDTMVKIDPENATIKYKRITTYKCPRGHRSKVESFFTEDLKPRRGDLVRDDSVKRYHRKGFAGHIVKPAHHDLVLPIYDPASTNHQRLVRRRALRASVANPEK